MDCAKIMDLVYEYSGCEKDPEVSMPLFYQAQVWLHVFFCPHCAENIARLKMTREIARHDFFASSPGLEDRIMEKIELEKDAEPYAVPGGLSTRGWVIAGIVIVLSLATAFFGLEFQNIARETGSSFLLPVGITIGIALTTYCAFFIGSHLKELTERFGL